MAGARLALYQTHSHGNSPVLPEQELTPTRKALTPLKSPSTSQYLVAMPQHKFRWGETISKLKHRLCMNLHGIPQVI